jgi:hypothetical protein
MVILGAAAVAIGSDAAHSESAGSRERSHFPNLKYDASAIIPVALITPIVHDNAQTGVITR